MYNKIKGSDFIMQEKYLYIDKETARSILRDIEGMNPEKSGVNSRVYLTTEYAVLYLENMKVRNVTVPDSNLDFLEQLANDLMKLYRQGTRVIPILGFCCDEESGRGYIIEPRAKGEELYHDEIMEKYYLRDDRVYQQGDRGEQEYILARTHFISQIPQEHFDRLMEDMIALLDSDILIDFMGKSNFFYDKAEGFAFIDLNSHTDYKYGLTDNKPDSRLICAYNGFVPCHIGAGSEIMPHMILDENALSCLDSREKERLKKDNRITYEKCRAAMLKNGVSREQLDTAGKLLRLFGV